MAATLGLALATVVVSPAAAVDESPVGEITGVFDDPDLVTPDGHAGGLRITGWVADADRGDARTELRATVAGATHYSVAGPESQAEFVVYLPLDPGTHTVCITAVNVGSGHDVSLGCVTGTVLRHTPTSVGAWMNDSPIVRDGLAVALSLRPLLLVGGCVTTATWGEPQSFEFSLAAAGEDGHRVETHALAPVGTFADGTEVCAWAEWTVDEDLHAGVEYAALGMMTVDDAEPTGWVEGQRFLAYRPPVTPVAVSPAEGAELSATPVLAVSVSPQDLPTAVVFQVVDADTGDVIAEGSAAPVEVSGNVEWSLPAPLPTGAYVWRALATDDVTQSPWSADRAFEIGLPPDPPEVIWARPRRLGLEVKWLPGNSVETPIIDYTMTVMPGSRSVTVLPDGYDYPTAVVDGLAPGTYTVRVTARNRFGTGLSGWPRTVTVTPPLALEPTDLQVVLDGSSATVSWDPPSDDGGSPVTSYRVTLQGRPAVTLPAAETSLSFDGLAFGAWYSLSVQAVTARGPGAAATTGFQPFTVPAQPTAVETTLGDGALDVSWTAPTFDGGAPVSGYVVTVQPGGATLDVTGRTHVRFSGLTNGTPYSFTVAAINDAGQGNASEPSEARAPVSQELDSDGDGLPDVLEEQGGSNSLLDDSDFDGLDDAVEVLQLTSLTSPMSADSDGDGIGDADADTDGDGLANADEVASGTEPADPDSDRDGAEDGQEVARGIDPLVGDSDGDGIGDGDEGTLGLDPLAADSDLDGVSDAEEEAGVVLESDGFRAEVRGAPADLVAVALQETSAFAVAGAVTVAATVTPPTTYAEVDPGQAPAATVASMTFRLPAAHDTTADLAAFSWVPERGWAPAGNTITVDATLHTVTVVSPALGVTYTVVDLDEWRAQARVCDLAVGGSAALDVEVVMDALPSAYDADPTGERFAAVTAMLRTLRPGDTARLRTYGVAVSSYGYGHSIDPWFSDGPDVEPLGTSVDRVLAQVDQMTGHSRPDLPELSGDISPWLGPYYAEQALGGLGQPEPPPAEANPYLPEGADVGALDCRAEAVIVVTDGQLTTDMTEVELPDGYVPFAQRTATPVHVLDIGAGDGSADWLRAVAAQSGGSYTHVPTAEPAAAWDRDSGAAEPQVDVTTDTDGDGIVDWVEYAGVTPAGSSLVSWEFIGTVFHSSPFDPDSDGDGLSDDLELGAPVTSAELGGWSSALPITTYRVVSDPARPDGDGDSLADVEEIELELNPLDWDMDGDGLDDGTEVEWGTHALLWDTEADGFSDGYEAARLDEGLDPLEVNLPVDPETWAQELALGFVCGDNDVCRRPTVPWLLGNIASGVLVFGDVRDIVASVAERRWVDTGLTGVGFVPGGGDAVAAVAKTMKILPEMAPAAAVAARRWISGAVRETPEILVDAIRQVQPQMVQKLEGLGVGASDIVRLWDRNGDRLAQLLDNPRVRLITEYPPRNNGPPGWFSSWHSAEEYMRTLRNLDPKVAPPGLHVGPTGSYPAGIRSPDGLYEPRLGFLILLESKMGRGARSMRQIARDKQLIAEDLVQGAEYHYFASAWTGRIGPSPAVLSALLESDSIEVFLHIPRTV